MFLDNSKVAPNVGEIIHDILQLFQGIRLFRLPMFLVLISNQTELLEDFM